MTPADLRVDNGDDEGPAGPDFEPIVPPRKKRSGKLWLLVAVVVSVAAGAGAWQYWGEKLMVDPDANIPLVRADEEPVKVQPENPGGMEVPDRDKLVYDRIEGNNERSSVERLLPPPESPMPMPEPEKQEMATTDQPGMTSAEGEPEASQVPPVPGTESSAESAPANPAAEQAEAPTVEEVLTAMRPPEPLDPKNIEAPNEPAPETEMAPEPKPEAVQELTSAPVTEPAPAAEAEPTPAEPQKADTSGFKVQLAALREEDGAMKEWSRLKKRHSDLLGSLEPSVMRADLGASKGVFFRLRAGPLAGEAAAKKLCEQLSERKVGCLVVRPEG